MSAEITLDDYRWLIDGSGRDWLDNRIDESLPLHQLANKLRRILNLTETHLVIEQHRLRHRASKKFVHANQLFFTPVGLEQASDQITADYKSDRFKPSDRVADLCCGIGGDLFSIGRRGPTIGFDRDEIACYLAQTNAKNLQLTESRVEQADVTEIDLSSFDAVHIDPDRRASGHRSVQLENHQPSLNFLVRLVKDVENVAIKLAPATEVTSPMLASAELEWIGSKRDCRQLVAWYGRLGNQPGKRVATILDETGSNSFSGELIPGEITSQLDNYLIEPHPPVLAAGLAGQLANKNNLSFITRGGGYLTGATPISSPFCSNYKVLEILPFRPKRIKSALQKRNVGHLVVKKRAVNQDPQQVQRACQPSQGEHSAVLFITALQERVTAVITQPHLDSRS
ncbi:MAG: class I SAM-dependent methyltransferase [Planctomycetaceae bacterium]|nr:class I SAM-dependent methyltransferase [Planctomycetaceae bacterium]